MILLQGGKCRSAPSTIITIAMTMKAESLTGRKGFTLLLKEDPPPPRFLVEERQGMNEKDQQQGRNV